MSESDSARADDPHVVAPRATRREWFALAIIALPCVVYAMDLTVLNLAIPALTAQLKPSASQMLWIIDIYGFMVAGFLITMGTLGDRFGRRRLLMAGAGAFALASALAAWVQSAEQLIALRALLGVAGATLAPSTLSLISNMFRHEGERRLAIGIWISSYSVGGVIGPLVGGVLIEYFSWPAVFLAAVPVMTMLLILGPSLLPEYRDPAAGRVDVASVALSLGAVLGAVFAVKRLAEGYFEVSALAVLLAAGVAGYVFVRRQARIDYPLLDVSLFKQARFAAAISTYGLTCFAMFGVYIFISQYLQIARGFSPLMAGIYTIPWALSFVVGSLLTPRLVRLAPAQRVVRWGLAVSALGFLMLLGVAGAHGLAWTVAGTVVMGLGVAPVFTLGNEVVVAAAPPERAGAASALSETSAELSGALGIAAFGSLATVIYRASMDPLLATSLPHVSQQEAGTLGGTVALAQALPRALAEPLIAQANAAFVHSLQVAAVVGAGAVVLAMGLSARLLRHERP